tara:strand:- start:3128 stop:4072 length:945 start_codon:yes stop_codon:yes gene_type:complete
MNISKKIKSFFFLLITGSTLVIILSFNNTKDISFLPYDSDYVQASSVTHDGEQYKVVWMKRSGKRVRAKYFAFKTNGEEIYERYNKWKIGKDIILYTSGTYMDISFDAKTAKLKGLTVDNGKVVNQSLAKQDGKNIMDGLVIVYPHGGIAVSNLEEGNLKLSGGGANPNKFYDLRGSSDDRYLFKSWAQSEKATVFQTHLLAWKDKLLFDYNYKTKSHPRERRFLAIGYGPNGETIHCIVHKPKNATLYDASNKVLKFLNERKGMEVLALLNLDTGIQDIFKLFTKSGAENGMIKSANDQTIYNARNLLAYYFE